MAHLYSRRNKVLVRSLLCKLSVTRTSSAIPCIVIKLLLFFLACATTLPALVHGRTPPSAAVNWRNPDGIKIYDYGPDSGIRDIPFRCRYFTALSSCPGAQSTAMGRKIKNQTYNGSRDAITARIYFSIRFKGVGANLSPAILFRPSTYRRNLGNNYRRPEVDGQRLDWLRSGN